MDFRAIITFLNRDVLRNIVLLKMLHAYSKAIQSIYVENDSGAGVLLLLPTRVSAFDTQTYPSSEYVVFLSTTGPAVTQALLPHIPTRRNLVFKFLDPADRVVVERRFSLERKTAYLSFTSTPERQFCASNEVVISNQVDERCLDLFAKQGHEHETVRRYFASAWALAFALYQNDLPLSACFAYLNFGSIWEIGGVYTAPGERRKGYARQVVETALHTLLRSHHIPRYQVQEDNYASIRLAEALRLRQFISIEHYMHEHNE